MAKSKSKQPRTLLAVDPGASAGLALFVDERYVGSRAVNGASHKELYEAIRSLKMDIGPPYTLPGPFLCVIEDGFGKGIGSKTLDRRRGLAMGAAEAEGFDKVIFVYPGTWHSQMFSARDSAGMKAEAMAWCKKWLNIEPKTHDEAEAVVLGHWAYGEYCQVVDMVT